MYSMNVNHKVGAYYEGRRGPGVRFLDLEEAGGIQDDLIIPSVHDSSEHSGESSSSSVSPSPSTTEL